MSKQPLIYQSPEAQVIDLCAQGVMCQSLNGVTVQDLYYDEDETLGC